MGQERRQFPRLTLPIESKVRRFGDFSGSWLPSRIVNLSAGGARVISETSCQVGDQLELQFDWPGSRGPLIVRGTVMWHKMPASGVTEHGIAFLDVPMDQQEQIDELVLFLRTTSPRAVPPS